MIRSDTCGIQAAFSGVAGALRGTFDVAAVALVKYQFSFGSRRMAKGCGPQVDAHAQV